MKLLENPWFWLIMIGVVLVGNGIVAVGLCATVLGSSMLGKEEGRLNWPKKLRSKTSSPTTEAKLDALRQKHASAIEKYFKHYEPYGPFGLPQLIIGNQGILLGFERVDELSDYEDEHREWLGIMICVALERLVEMHSQNT